MTHDKCPQTDEIERIFAWAQSQNPGKWGDHSRVVARAARTIAGACGLDADMAYASGLLHDVGRYEGNRHMHHIVAGYELLRGKGHARLAGICLTHSFPYQDIGEYLGERDCTGGELQMVASYLERTVYDDYDKLIQLCDAIGTADGVSLMEIRIVDVVRRYGFNGMTLKKWDAVFALKDYFDSLCNKNIYDLFYDEIRNVNFR